MYSVPDFVLNIIHQDVYFTAGSVESEKPPKVDGNLIFKREPVFIKIKKEKKLSFKQYYKVLHK